MWMTDENKWNFFSHYLKAKQKNQNYIVLKMMGSCHECCLLSVGKGEEKMACWYQYP